jgi:hypothetical protein
VLFAIWLTPPGPLLKLIHPNYMIALQNSTWWQHHIWQCPLLTVTEGKKVHRCSGFAKLEVYWHVILGKRWI